MSASPRPFDRARRRGHRQRFQQGPDFLRRAIEERLLDRLDDVRRPLGRVLVLGAQDGGLARAIAARSGVERVVTADERGPCDVLLDEELLPFRPGAFTTVLSALSLHWVNDLPGLLLQIRHCLVADGLLLAAFPGGATLCELREVLLAAELETTGGAGLRLAPMVDVRDAGALLQRAGFALPVADVERLTVRYAEPLRLLLDLRAMAEAQALTDGARSPLGRAVLARFAELYRERFADVDGKVRASFDIVTLTGWSPHASQPTPLRRGSGEFALAEALRGERGILQGKAPE